MWLVMLLFMFFSCNRQIQLNPFLRKNPGPSSRIYIVGRGTVSKSSLLVAPFNTTDSMLTHIGLAFEVHENLEVFHVTDQPRNRQAACQRDGYEIFSCLPEVRYTALWERVIPRTTYRRLLRFCKKSCRRSIQFDTDFQLHNGNRWYCSEFCAIALQKAGLKIPAPLKVALSVPLFRSYLRRDTLIYFPVDFFLQDSLFRKVSQP